MTETPLIVLTWLGFVLNLMVAIFMVVSLNRVFPVRNKIQWEARHFGPLSFSVFFSVWFVIVERNLQLFGSASGYFDMGIQLRWILNNFFSFGFLATYALRAWLVYFDYNTGMAMLAQIDSSMFISPQVREQQEWFILNKSYYGSPKYLSQFLAAVTTVLTLALWGWVVMSELTFYYGMVAIYAILLCIIMMITKKLSTIEDSLFIRYELLWEFRILAGFFLVLGLLIIFGTPMGWNYCMFFVIEASVLAITAMATIATLGMLEVSRLFSFPIVMEKHIQSLRKEPEEQRSFNTQSLQLILDDQTTTLQFLRYLVSELSLENIYFLADIMNFKNTIVQRVQVLKTIPGFYVRVPNLAKYNLAPNGTFVEYARTLSHAYIENISATYVTAIYDETRITILDYLEDLDTLQEQQFQPENWKELCTAFDEAAKEVWKMLEQSWKRFTRTPNFSESQTLLDMSRGLSDETRQQLQPTEVTLA